MAAITVVGHWSNEKDDEVNEVHDKMNNTTEEAIDNDDTKG